MIIINPKTKEKIEVDDKHGEMLLSQGFYQRDNEGQVEMVEQPKRRRGRPSKQAKKV